jgi:hypothetical protein
MRNEKREEKIENKPKPTPPTKNQNSKCADSHAKCRRQKTKTSKDNKQQTTAST